MYDEIIGANRVNVFNTPVLCTLYVVIFDNATDCHVP